MTLVVETPVELATNRGQIRPQYVASSQKGTPQLLPLDAGEQYRFGFSMDACVGCHSCEVACAEQNGLPPTVAWRRVGEIEGGEFPAARRFHLSMSCNHCLEPACLEGCPTNAYVKLDNGVVAQHADDCIGCQYCTWNCPYNVPAFQPDRRIVTKCDMCLPRLDAGSAPACVAACPTHAITVEKVRVDEWRADHSQADAPNLPPSGLTLSTTRIELPRDVPLDTFAASDWNLRPEHPHSPLVWLTMLTQVALGVAATASTTGHWMVAAGLAGLALLIAPAHLGRPGVAWKALRNLRRSWLSREVAAFVLAFVLASAAVVFGPARPVAVLAAAAGVYASARLYIVPGRPAWNTPLTVVSFFATGLACGPLVTGHPAVAAVGLAIQLAALGVNLLRLGRHDDQAWWGVVWLYLRWFRSWTALRVVLAVAAIGLAGAGAPWPALALALGGELIGRWLFFVTVVPLNMPGSFWRGSR
ncbi:MAG: DmsC/YnfH family molybdoenzyme membrane anchor subunit [Acidimicrobiales bacterium]